jgi:hypothetical protein
LFVFINELLLLSSSSSSLSSLRNWRFKVRNQLEWRAVVREVKSTSQDCSAGDYYFYYCCCYWYPASCLEGTGVLSLGEIKAGA